MSSHACCCALFIQSDALLMECFVAKLPPLAGHGERDTGPAKGSIYPDSQASQGAHNLINSHPMGPGLIPSRGGPYSQRLGSWASAMARAEHNRENVSLQCASLCDCLPLQIVSSRLWKHVAVVRTADYYAAMYWKQRTHESGAFLARFTSPKVRGNVSDPLCAPTKLFCKHAKPVLNCLPN